MKRKSKFALLHIGAKYIKILAWPVVVIFLLYPNMSRLLTVIDQVSKVSIGGVTVEFRKLEKIVLQLNEIQNKNPDNPVLNEDIEEIKNNIQNLFGETCKAVGSLRTKASCWEQLGFQRVINKDVAQAITAFSNAEKSWPGFHNAMAIHNLLNAEKTGLLSTDLKVSNKAWKTVYKSLLSDYSWGMGEKTRLMIRNAQQ